MKKSSINGLLIGAILLDSVLTYTLIRSYKRSKQLLNKQEPFTNRTYIKLERKDSVRKYTDLGATQKKKAM